MTDALRAWVQKMNNNKTEAQLDREMNNASERMRQGVLSSQIEADKRGAERAKKNQAVLDARIAKYGNKINRRMVTMAPSTSAPLQNMVM